MNINSEIETLRREIARLENELKIFRARSEEDSRLIESQRQRLHRVKITMQDITSLASKITQTSEVLSE